MFTVLHKRTNELDKNAQSSDLEYGEIALNYKKDSEALFIKNDENEVVVFKGKDYFDTQIQSNSDRINTIENDILQLFTNTTLKFYCIEPVTVTINDKVTTYEANSYVNVLLRDDATFSIEPTSDNSILSLNAYPGTINEFYSWLEGVQVFDSVVFNMNSEDMYVKWNQGNQGRYHVQMAQYNNCVFWSDNPYISDVSKRTNYTLYSSAHLPLCYSTIPENTFKSFYCAYGVKFDPNWANPTYRESFAAATWATQVFSYYGAKTIGVYNMDSSLFNIPLPKDCRGLMFYSTAIESAGVFDAAKTTNFGAKKGSWQDAFSNCYSLQELYIKNLKANINVSWSPLSQESLNYILSHAANTSKITISLSPYTYYSLTETNKSLATEHNITLELLTTNVSEDGRVSTITLTGDGDSYLANDGTYKNIALPTKLSELENDTEFLLPEDLKIIDCGEY